MRAALIVFVLTTACSPCLVSAMQSPAGDTPTPIAAPTGPSDLLQPSLNEVQQTVAALKLDRWKKGTVRDEAGSNISAIQRDLQETLPPLLKTADASPSTISKVLPVSRNIDAIYDVLVHVFEAARVSAPGDQVGQLQQAMGSLEKARVAFGNRLQDTATAQEKQIVDLRTSLQTQTARAAAPPPPAPTCVTPTPARKKKPKATTTPAKTTTPPATTTPKTP
jgi:hypothetical protein